MDGNNAKVESFQILIETQWNTIKESEFCFFPINYKAFILLN